MPNVHGAVSHGNRGIDADSPLRRMLTELTPLTSKSLRFNTVELTPEALPLPDAWTCTWLCHGKARTGVLRTEDTRKLGPIVDSITPLTTEGFGNEAIPR